jgi:Arc/MetJ family transcription regulator
MRTNIDIDDKLLAQARRVAGTKTKKETVEYALRELVRRKRRRAILDLRGNFEWIGDLDESRRSRFD